jgi:hypothetical protein
VRIIIIIIIYMPRNRIGEGVEDRDTWRSVVIAVMIRGVT